MSCFVFAGAAFVARLIVAIHAGCLANEKAIARPSEDIGRPKEEKKRIVRLKIVVGTV
jgi:hypothetical protein